MLHIVQDTHDQHDEPDSEAQALARILSWSKDWPRWQRDALRRLCTKNELNDTDLDELAALCKSKAHGGVPLAAQHIPDPSAAVNVVNLRAIYGAENVNALKPGERLTFDKIGLTVVYGDNGSGKSGYARILKKVCRARTPSGDEILPNIYASKTGPQEAVVDFSAGGHNKSDKWTTATASDPLLSSVSVFDSRTANVHVDAVNNVAYTPFPMLVLARLAEACLEIKKRIDAEIRELERRTPAAITAPDCHDGTVVRRLIAALSGSTKENIVRDLATLTDTERARLDTLRTDLGKAPLKVARRLEKQKKQVEEATGVFEALQLAASDSQAHRLKELYQARQTAQAAATAAAGDLFADDPLTNIGSDAWRTLWEAARTYSEKQAYKDSAFPNTNTGARCVLCQQELGTDAADRLQRFEAFVKDETKRREARAARVYQEGLDALTSCAVRADAVQAATALFRDELDDDALAKRVRRSGVTLRWRQRAILRNRAQTATTPLPPSAPWPSDEIRVHVASLSGRITALHAQEESEERNQMRAEFEELSDREWLSVIQEDVIAEVERRKKRAALQSARKDTTTNRITARSTELADGLVTNALRAQFSKEVNRLGVAGLAIELRQARTTYGVPHFRVSLIRQPDARVGQILSEGEHRCVALAAFLAELATTESGSAIVFDDPVSSLDHMHREAVAERLADEGHRRQIVIFTHDLAFLFLLDQKCRDKGTHVAFRCITRTDDFAGFCQQDPPARAQPLDRVVDGMQRQLDNEKLHYSRGDHEKWERTVDSLQRRLRSSWERAVEEAVGPVVKRLSNKVETKGLAKVITLTMDDCTKMRQAYGRCSTLLHSSADALNPPLPTPETIESEIVALRQWVDDVQRRQDKIEWLQ